MSDALLMKPSAAWNMVSCLNIGIAAVMAAAKGFYAMAALMLVNSTAAITRSIRDAEQSQRLHTKIDEARTERLLMETAGPHG